MQRHHQNMATEVPASGSRYAPTPRMLLSFFWFLSTVGVGAEPDNIIEEILVTASKAGATNLLDTAVTATVVSGEQIEFREIRNPEDLQFQTPGMIVDPGLATPKISIRGIGHDNFVLAAENGVAVYSNDILLGRTQSMLGAFFDLERVDVLKGPQGTSFGRNATGGSVNFVGRRPVVGTEVEFGLTGGSFDRREAYGVFNYGTDRYGVRIGAKYNEDDGFARNLLTGSDLNGVEQTAVRASFSFAPVESFEGLLRIDYTDEDFARPATAIVAVEPFSLPIDIFGGIGGYDSGEDYEVVSNVDSSSDVKTGLTSLHLDWDIGGLHLRSISGYLKGDAPSLQDVDQSDVELLLFDNKGIENEQYSQEFVLSGTRGSLDWLTGLYYLREDSDIDLLVAFAEDFPGGGVQSFADSQKLTSAAVFAQGIWNFTDNTRLVLGARYTADEKEFDYDQVFTLGAANPAPGFVVPLCQDSVEESWEDTTWEMTLERDLGANAFGYVKVNTGFKAGGFNTSLCGLAFDPEEITAYEIGYKGTFREGALTFSGSAFYYDYTDLQVTQLVNVPGTNTNTTKVANAAVAEVYGLDVELRALMPGGLSADVAFSWIPTADYESFDTIDALDLREADGDPATIAVPLDLSGNRLNRAPEYSGVIGVNYEGRLGATWQLDARVELYLTDDVAFSPFDRPNPFNASVLTGLVKDSNIQKGYELLNAYVGLHYEDGWTLRLYGKNLTDEYYYSGIVENNGSGHISGEFGRPREGGIQLIYQFATD